MADDDDPPTVAADRSRRRPGRPAGQVTERSRDVQYVFRTTPEQIAAVDGWAKAHGCRNMAEAMRLLIDAGLGVPFPEPPPIPSSHLREIHKVLAAARDLAAAVGEASDMS